MYNLRWTCDVMKCSIEKARIETVDSWTAWDGIEISDLTDLYEISTFFDEYFTLASFAETGEFQLIDQDGQVVYHRRYGENPIRLGFPLSIKEKSELEI